MTYTRTKNFTENATTVGADLEFELDAIATAVAAINANAKIGTFTRDVDAAGDQAITGVGFTPTNIIFLAAESDTSQTMRGSFGFAVAASWASLFYTATDEDHNVSSDAAITIANKSDGTLYFRGTIKTMDADGFTITWAETTPDLPNDEVTIAYLALA